MSAVQLQGHCTHNLGAFMSNKDLAIQGLLIERAGYVARNLPKRVAAVDAALTALGHKTTKVETASYEPATEKANKPEPTKRKK